LILYLFLKKDAVLNKADFGASLNNFPRIKSKTVDRKFIESLFNKQECVMKQKWFYVTLSILTLFIGQAFGMDFRTDITGPGAVDDGGVWKILPDSEFTINVYANNNDTILPPPYEERTTWTSSFGFTGTISVQWQDIIANNTLLSDATSMGYFVPDYFSAYWDIINGVYAESWDGSLPDRLCFVGIANKFGYPSGLGEIQVMHFRAKTSSTSGQICIEKADMDNNVYDWIFDDPMPYFVTTCWDIKESGQENQPPDVGDIPDQTINEGSTFATINLDDYVVDPDNADADLTWSFSGNIDLTVDITDRIATITAPGVNWNGAETITFRATDPGALYDEDAATFTVTAVNEPPVVSDIPDQTISEGETFATINLDDYVVDPDNADDEITWLAVGSVDLLISIVDRVATIQIPDENWNGIEIVTFIATDPSSAADSDMAVLTVNPVNDPPVITPFASPVDINELDSFHLTITATDIDGEIPGIGYVTVPDNALFADNGDGTAEFDFTPDTNQAGTYVIDFIAYDGHAGDTATLVINVHDYVPEMPCLAVAPSELNFDLNVCLLGKGTYELNDYLYISNCGTGDLNWTIGDLPDWLLVDKASGTNDDTVMVTFTVTYPDTMVWLPGDTIFYDGSITIEAAGATGSPTEIPVHGVVYCDIPIEPCLAVSPDSLAYYIDYCEPWNSYDSVNINIFNCNGGILEWEIAYAPAWIHLPIYSGSGDIIMTASFDYMGIDPDDTLAIVMGDTVYYSDSIVVVSSNGSNSPQVILATATIYCPPPAPPEYYLAAWPTFFNLTAYEGETLPDEFLAVYEMSGGAIPFTFANMESWLTVVDTSYLMQTPDTLLMQFNLAGLTPGVYVDSVLIFADSAVNSPIAIPVVLTIYPVIEPGVDSVWVATVPGTPGSDVMVPVYFKNAEDLSAIALPMNWNSEDVTLDSVSFNGTRVEYVDFKDAVIRNDSNDVHMIIMPITEPAIAPGRGLLANMFFSIDDGVDPQFVAIDTIHNLTDSLLFGTPTGEFFTPTFICGGIVIDTTTGYVCGRVIDIYGNEIQGATVELWDNFPGGSMFYSDFSDINGQFNCNSFAIFPFDAYAYKEGYYPGLVEDVEYGDIGFDIVLTPVPEPSPSNEWVNFYCEYNTYMNVPLPVGSVIDAYDPDGVHCGTFFVHTAGDYGPLVVYRDDVTTEEDDGADPGDEITFYVNGYLANASGMTIWTEKGDFNEACLEVLPTETVCITLHEGWNLISWNVDTPDDYIETLLDPVMECVEVVLGFEQGGFTYDPDLTDFSTLWDLDHFHGFWVKMDCEMELCVTGAPVSATTPIELEQGWNLVSYLPDECDSTAHALNSIMDDLIVALGFEDGGLSYDPELPEYSTLREMCPGYGYWVKVTQAGQLIYPGMGPGVARPQALAKLDKAAVDNRVPTSGLWVNLYSRELTIDGQPAAAGSEILAINRKGEIVGAATVADNGKFGFMPVYGDDPTTTEREGLNIGDEFSLIVNGLETAETFTWTENGARIEVKSVTSKGGSAVIPNDYSLMQNFPNPFNPTTSISFSMPAAAQATLEIYNVLGEKVKTVFNGMANAGLNTVVWEGVDENGQTVASGIYFYRLKTTAFEQTRKMVLMK
jgi:hypothetical protein